MKMFVFTRVLRKPEKQLRVIPQVVEARRKEYRGCRKTMGDDGTFPPSIAYDDRKNNTKSCSSDLRTEPQPADPNASIRQWPLRKLAGCAYTCTESRTQRSRHLALKHHYIVELERNGRITSRKINSSDNLADVFTKALPAPQYLNLIDQFTVRLRDFDLEGARLLSKS
eukprot:g18969.t1